MTLGDQALRLYEIGRYDAVFDAFDMVVRCGGSLDLRDLLIFGLSARQLGKDDIARWCRDRACELAARDEAPVEIRGLALAVDRHLSNSRSTAPATSLLSLRVEEGSTR